jgi:hypothetical protein
MNDLKLIPHATKNPYGKNIFGERHPWCVRALGRVFHELKEAEDIT